MKIWTDRKKSARGDGQTSRTDYGSVDENFLFFRLDVFPTNNFIDKPYWKLLAYKNIYTYIFTWGPVGACLLRFVAFVGAS